MVDMYKIVESLCRREGISIAEMCRNINMRQSVITDLKHGRTKSLSHANMLKISDFFQISTDVFNDCVWEESQPNDADLNYYFGADASHLKSQLRKFPEQSEKLNDDEIKFALFGDTADITDDMYEDVKQYAKFVAERKRQKGSK